MVNLPKMHPKTCGFFDEGSKDQKIGSKQKLTGSLKCPTKQAILCRTPMISLDFVWEQHHSVLGQI